MKRILPLLLAVMLAFGLAGQASAAFEDTQLIGVLYGYEAGGGAMNQYLLDLGSMDNITGNSIDLSTTDFSMLYGAVVGLDTTFGATPFDPSTYEAMVGVADEASPGLTGSQFTPFTTAYTNAFAGFAGSADSTLTLENFTADPNSYAARFDFILDVNDENGLDPAGSFANWTSPGNTISLAGLADAPEFLYLFEASGTNPEISGLDNLTASSIPAVRISADGSVVSFTPVPVPAAVWLLGSGLIGLLGIRRKRS